MKKEVVGLYTEDKSFKKGRLSYTKWVGPGVSLPILSPVHKKTQPLKEESSLKRTRGYQVRSIVLDGFVLQPTKDLKVVYPSLSYFLIRYHRWYYSTFIKIVDPFHHETNFTNSNLRRHPYRSFPTYIPSIY